MHRIKEVLKEKGLSISDFADIMGVKQPSISSLLNGNPTLEKLEQIARALNMSVVELIEKKDYSHIVCPYCENKITIESKTDIVVCSNDKNKFKNATR